MPLGRLAITQRSMQNQIDRGGVKKFRQEVRKHSEHYRAFNLHMGLEFPVTGFPASEMPLTEPTRFLS